MARKIAIYLSSCTVSLKTQQDTLCSIADYQKIPYDIFIEDEKNINDRKVRRIVISKLQYDYKTVYVYNLECFSNNIKDCILIPDFLISEKRNFFIKEERLNYTWDLGYGNLKFVKSLKNMLVKKEIKRKQATEEFIIVDLTCPLKCKKDDDEPHFA